MMDEIRTDIRGVLVPISETRLLLPNAVIAEVITFVSPDPVATKATWLLGKVNWRNYKLPLVSIASFAGFVGRESLLNVKIAILKGLSGQAQVPYLAILTQGFPKLTVVGPESVQVDTVAQRRDGIAMSVRLTADEADAHIPDLDAIEGAVARELA
jgi:chemosensory pili system protein ChpC